MPVVEDILLQRIEAVVYTRHVIKISILSSPVKKKGWKRTSANEINWSLALISEHKGINDAARRDRGLKTNINL